jgi:hypothetical protein
MAKFLLDLTRVTFFLLLGICLGFALGAGAAAIGALLK